ncbi:uncharacterized protein LOC143243176 isoform X3 [Tachypleus tridentatus]|uniref:uncharacterized protein LOC143243176 isoform X3 n=1 Tax=Tachypleus tridentatus TaxID=6853 RepID=UPI003FD47C16
MSLRDISFKEAVKLLRETASPVGCYRKSLNLIYNSPEFIDDNQLSDNQVYRQPTFPLPVTLPAVIFNFLNSTNNKIWMLQKWEYEETSILVIQSFKQKNIEK